MSDPGYHEIRLPHDPHKAALWAVLVRHGLQRFISEGARVLDLGCGHGYFINAVQARERHALDAEPAMKAFLDPAVLFHAGDVRDLSGFADGSLDAVFASNLLEHLDHDDAARLLGSVRRILAPGGRLILLQPNFKYCASSYFDDYTHRTAWSHVSLADRLRASGFEVERLIPRWLPFRGSPLPASPLSPLLARIYLMLPWRPFAAQMLAVAQPRP